MKKLTCLFFVLAIAFVLFSCKKDNPSKTDLLTGKYWIITSETISPGIVINGTTITDLYNQELPCRQDDLQKFDKPNAYTYDEGASKCSTNDPQTQAGLWAFNSDQTIVTVTFGSNIRSYKITSLTASTLQAVYTEEDDWGSGTFLYTYTFTAVVH